MTEAPEPARSPRRRRRYLIVIGGLLTIVLVLALVKYAQIASLVAKGEELARAGTPPEVVSSDVARAGSWESSLAAIGSVARDESVTITNELPGVVTRIYFKSGDLVRRGQILVELDANAERAQVTSAKARRDYARVTARQSRTLVAREAIPRTELERDETQLEAAEADVVTAEAQLERKLVRAPFAGRLGISAINPGQYLDAGTTVAVLDAVVGDVFVDISLPQEQLPMVAVGMPVRITIRGDATPAHGVITAISPTVDPTSRNARLRARVPNRDRRLRPGMFVTSELVTPVRTSVVTVPANAIVHAPYGDSVFVIEDKPPGSPGMTVTPEGKPVKIARQQFVRLGATRGDFVAVLEGITAGQQIVSAGAFKLRNGSPVVIDNTVQAVPQLNPRPENR